MQQEVWFWQTIVSPHMAGLAKALANLGHKVVYVAEQEMTAQRAAQGWQPSSLGKATLQLTPSNDDALALAEQAPREALHICQGVRGNGQVALVQKRLKQLSRPQWVVMETVEDTGWQGVVKRLGYGYLLRRLGTSLQGVLATGCNTPQWVIERGVPADKVYPFAYFLPESFSLNEEQALAHNDGRFRILFVGQFIERKRLGLLIDALSELNNPAVDLVVVGSGPLEDELRTKAKQLLGSRVQWVGRLPMTEVHRQVAEADCLVLPSRHDGWGAVVVEALMAGTPAICSDHCGAAEAVTASSVGGVFRSGDKEDLINKLGQVISAGKPTQAQRNTLASWASSFGAKAGARYLAQILAYSGENDERPVPPWLQKSR